MAAGSDRDLTRRERQILEILHIRGEASVAEIAERLPDPPSHPAVRTLLRILEDKRHIRRRKVGRAFFYRASGSPERAARAAFNRVLRVFFDDSLSDAIASHLADPAAKHTPEEVRRLEQIIRQARKGPRT